MTRDEICAMIGADSLGYLSLNGLRRAACGYSGSHCASCFDGEFPAGMPLNEKTRIFQPVTGFPLGHSGPGAAMPAEEGKHA